MAEPDLHHTLLLCGLERGDEDYLPAWYKDIAVKNISAEGKGRIIRSLFKELTYDEHPIPALPTTVTMLINKAWVGNDPSNTAQATMKGLSPYIFMPCSKADVQAASELHNTTSEAMTKTKGNVLMLAKQLKPATPKSFSSLIGTLHTFANLLGICFGKRSPLYVDLLSDEIGPLAQWTEIAKGAVASRGAIMWAIFKQAHHFAQGDMHGEKTKYRAEWKVMLLSIESASNFTLLKCPVLISRQTPNPQKPTEVGIAGGSKRKLDGEQGGGCPPGRLPNRANKAWTSIPLSKSTSQTFYPPGLQCLRFANCVTPSPIRFSLGLGCASTGHSKDIADIGSVIINTMDPLSLMSLQKLWSESSIQSSRPKSYATNRLVHLK